MSKIKENSTNNINRRLMTECDMTYAVNIMSGRWKLLILTQLIDGKLRFGELRKRIQGITERMLTLQLREMEMDGLLIRTVYPEVPPKVEYHLTEIGTALVPICDSLHKWGTKHRMEHTGVVSIATHGIVK
jgi:DNA-binding HxlR family transcriptional regulator